MNPVKAWATPARQALTRHKWRWIAVAAVSMAVFGLVQYLSGAKRMFWVWELPYLKIDDAAKGSFGNRNPAQAISFLVAAMPPI